MWDSLRNPRIAAGTSPKSPGAHLLHRYTGEIAPFRQPVLIYNPAAGKLRRDPQGILRRTTAALSSGTSPARLLPTCEPGHAEDLARQAIADGADLILVLGGDGTINEAVQGIANSDATLGVLPGGTANVLAMELGLGANLEKAARRLTQAEPVSIALGKVTPLANGTGAGPADPRYFLLMCGAGLDASILTAVSPSLKAATGKFAYWVAGFAHVSRRVPSFEICVDGQRRTCGFALMSRVRNYGGDLEIASRASLRNDDFHVVWFEGNNPLRYMGYMLTVAARQVLRMPGVHHARARSVEIAIPAPAQIDGEYLGVDRFRVEIQPRALTMLMPTRYR